MTKFATGFATTLAALALISGCSREPAKAPPASPASEAPQTSAVIASVAASTIDAMERLASRFQEQSGDAVKFNAGPSNALATQILAGAPAGLFLSASKEWADKVDEGGQAAERVDLLTNRLVVVVPKGNPAQIDAPDDLASDAVAKLALAGENVPAGKYAEQALAKLSLLAKLNDTKKIVRGQDVRAALAYVERGEAEAGIVYATDVSVGAGVETAFEFDAALHDEIVYVLVLLKHGEDNSAAREFYEYLQGDEAAQVFSQLGFTPRVAAAN